jgi:hypothetical protein
LWGAVAEEFDRTFARYEAHYAITDAHGALAAKDYPRLFQMCRDASGQRYYRMLAEMFAPRQPTPVYERFLNTLRKMNPLSILTTDVDEMLEQNLSTVAAVQRSDTERCLDLLDSGQSFVCKLHGSVSQVESTVFTTADYARLFGDQSFLALVNHMFRECAVVFIGYSLADAYVIQGLDASAASRRIFGDGPHFAVAATEIGGLLPSIRPIRYRPDAHLGHRAPIQVLEVIQSCRCWNVREPNAPKVASLRSAHFISAIHLPAPFKSGWTLTLALPRNRPEGGLRQIVYGDGMTPEERPPRSTLAHDLIVGLLCFDEVFLPVNAAPLAHDFFGADLFWHVAETGALRFVRSNHAEGIGYYSDTDIAGGGLTTYDILGADERRIPTREILGKHIHAHPGFEALLDHRLESAAVRTPELGVAQFASVVERTNGLLLLPQIRRMLGMSGGTPIDSIPRWLAYPVLRLANIVHVGIIADMLDLCSVKLLYGASGLASVAFSAVGGDVWADQMASYVVVGRFDSDLGDLIARDPSVLAAVLKFRATQPGEQLRQEVLQQVKSNSGSELVTSIDGGLQRTLPLSVLQKARDQMAALLIAHGGPSPIPPAAWSDMPTSGEPLRKWRAASALQFREYCQKQRIGSYDLCPCRSGEKRRFCCDEALDAL